MANIVVCSDGTWNRPEEDLEKDHPSNVLKLARGISPETNGVAQHVFYDWGLGAYHSKLSAGTTGRGIHKNILDGYRYIVQGRQVHITDRWKRHAVVTLTQNDTKVWWGCRWWVDADALRRAHDSQELHWTPADRRMKPMIFFYRNRWEQ